MVLIVNSIFLTKGLVVFGNFNFLYPLQYGFCKKYSTGLKDYWTVSLPVFQWSAICVYIWEKLSQSQEAIWCSWRMCLIGPYFLFLYLTFKHIKTWLTSICLIVCRQTFFFQIFKTDRRLFPFFPGKRICFCRKKFWQILWIFSSKSSKLNTCKKIYIFQIREIKCGKNLLNTQNLCINWIIFWWNYCSNIYTIYLWSWITAKINWC